jgi:hypothetical protein
MQGGVSSGIAPISSSPCLSDSPMQTDFENLLTIWRIAGVAVALSRRHVAGGIPDCTALTHSVVEIAFIEKAIAAELATIRYRKRTQFRGQRQIGHSLDNRKCAKNEPLEVAKIMEAWQLLEIRDLFLAQLQVAHDFSATSSLQCKTSDD